MSEPLTASETLPPLPHPRKYPWPPLADFQKAAGAARCLAAVSPNPAERREQRAGSVCDQPWRLQKTQQSHLQTHRCHRLKAQTLTAVTARRFAASEKRLSVVHIKRPPRGPAYSRDADESLNRGPVRLIDADFKPHRCHLTRPPTDSTAGVCSSPAVTASPGDGRLIPLGLVGVNAPTNGCRPRPRGPGRIPVDAAVEMGEDGLTDGEADPCRQTRKLKMACLIVADRLRLF